MFSDKDCRKALRSRVGKCEALIKRAKEGLMYFWAEIFLLGFLLSVCMLAVVEHTDADYRKARDTEWRTRPKFKGWDSYSPHWPLPGLSPPPSWEKETERHVIAKERSRALLWANPIWRTWVIVALVGLVLMVALGLLEIGKDSRHGSVDGRDQKNSLSRIRPGLNRGLWE